MRLIDPRRDVFRPGSGLVPVLVPVLVLLASALTVNCETHSLTYIYTAFSKDPQSPGLHKFSALGLLDGRIIDYFDNDNPQKVPKQEWMKEQEDKDYWKKGSETRKNKMDWFNTNLRILMGRLAQNESDLHTLQWLHGCEATTGEDGLKFTRGLDMYNYDGQNFLQFDDINGVWTTANTAAVQTKRKWDGVPALKDYTRTYLERECCQWMDKFLKKEQEQLEKSPPPQPEVFLFSPAAVNGRVRLTCLATGFYPRDAELQMTRNGDVLTWKNGVQRTGVRPNHDDTYQQRATVEILTSDVSKFTCELRHPSFAAPIMKDWDSSQLSTSSALAIGAGVGALVVCVLVALLLFGLYKMGKIAPFGGKKEGSLETLGSAGQQSNSSSSSGDSGQTKPLMDGKPPENLVSEQEKSLLV